jgi:hypothetical protein
MNEDPRCGGSSTCVIENESRYCCGQPWNGQKMCHAPQARAPVP